MVVGRVRRHGGLCHRAGSVTVLLSGQGSRVPAGRRSVVVLCRGATSIVAGHTGRATVMARYRAGFAAKTRVV